jgi:hypothetical protein
MLARECDVRMAACWDGDEGRPKTPTEGRDVVRAEPMTYRMQARDRARAPCTTRRLGFVGVGDFAAGRLDADP